MKVLFFGLGSIGKRHARLIQKIRPDIEIYALRHKNSAGKFQSVKNVYSESEAFECMPDIAFITNPTSMHIDSALKSAQNGCSLFIEKPLSDDLKNADKLIEIVNKKGIITLMGCNLRFNPVLMKVKELIEAGILGKVLNFRVSCGSYLPEWRPDQDYTKSYSAKKSLGGGVVLDLIHEIDYTYWIFGDFKRIKSIIGNSGTLKIETEDYAEVLIETQEGISGSMHLDYFRRQPERFIEIVCQNGIIKGDMINNYVKVLKDDDEKIFNFKIDRDLTYENQLKYFIDCVENKKNTFNTIETGYKILKYAIYIKGER